MNYETDLFSQILRSFMIIEQSSHVFSEGFHLSKEFIKKHLNQETFQYLNVIHHGAHAIEDILEAINFIKDGVDFYRNDFTVRDHDSGKIDYFKTGAKVAHLISHILKPIILLSNLKILALNPRLERIFKISIPIFHLIGFTAYSVSLLWKKHLNQTQEKHFQSDLIIQTGNIIFIAVPIAKTAFHLQGTAAKISTIVASATGLISGLFVLYRLHSIKEDKIQLCTVVRTPKSRTISKSASKLSKQPSERKL